MRSSALRAFTALALAGAVLCGCAASTPSAPEASRGLNPNETPELRALIDRYAGGYGVPRDLVQRVVIRESNHRPGARNGPYYGLMQILPENTRAGPTACSTRKPTFATASDTSAAPGWWPTAIPTRRSAGIRAATTTRRSGWACSRRPACARPGWSIRAMLRPRRGEETAR